MQRSALLVLAALGRSSHAAPLLWSWDRPSTFIHCSNISGPLSPAAAQAMAASSFAVIEKYQALQQPPVRAGGELKVMQAARQVRALNANATMIFYYAVDYTRTWYDLGRWFDEHPYLQVHNADGRRANHSDSDGGGPNTWGIFDWAQAEARSAWVDRLASVVSTADDNGNNLFDGVFIDGYRSASSWAPGLIPGASAAEQQAWLAGALLLGPALAEALGNDTIRFINPGQTSSQFPGYSANSIEFFSPKDSDIQFLQSLIGVFPTIEVHSYIGANLALFNLTLAAYLIGVGPGAYFGAGSQWAQCDDWLTPHWEYEEALGAPDGVGALNASSGQWSRSFAGGATRVTLSTGSSASGSASADCHPELLGDFSIAGTAQVFALASANATHRVYNLSCSTACSTFWHTATATSPAPFGALHIVYHMQPGFHPVQDDGVFFAQCSVLQWRGGSQWCAMRENPSCSLAPPTSCVRWASGRVTGNGC